MHLLNIRQMENQQPAAANKRNPRHHQERKPWDQLLAGLEDKVLIECYNNAIEMALEDAFIELLHQEIEMRGIDVHTSYASEEFLQNLQSV